MLLKSFALFALRARGLHLSLEDLEVIGGGVHVLDGVGPLVFFFRNRGDFSETRATSGFRSEEIVWADSELDVIVAAIGESDSEETEIGVSRDILGAGQAGGLALSQAVRLITCG